MSNWNVQNRLKSFERAETAMIEPKPKAKMPPSLVAKICLFGGVGIGIATFNLLKASFPQVADAGSVLQLVMAVVCGAIGGGLGAGAGWLYDRIRR